jgi:DNA modification methylase
MDFERLFKQSLTGSEPLESKLVKRFDLAELVTFAQNKKTAIYNWFYYKEGFSRDFVWKTLEGLEIPEKSLVLDPFCGTGTTLLACKQAGFNSLGFDILPLGVFVSRVKLEDNYNVSLLESESRRLTSLRFEKPQSKLVDIRFLDMRKVYNPYARDDIAFFKEKIMQIEDEKTRNFLLLGLLSIVSQCSNIKKDGGVLKVVRNKGIPVRHLLKNKLKRMIHDLKEDEFKNREASFKVDVGDARKLETEDSSIDAVITSPPYLNNIDYTKVYALELSLLVNSAKEMEQLRRMSMRSHVGASYELDEKNPAVEKVLDKIRLENNQEKLPLVVEGYFNDLHHSLKEASRVLKSGGCAVYVVANATLPNLAIDIDLHLAEIAEQNGFQTMEIQVANARWADVHGISKPKPARESAVIVKKK